MSKDIRMDILKSITTLTDEIAQLKQELREMAELVLLHYERKVYRTIGQPEYARRLELAKQITGDNND